MKVAVTARTAFIITWHDELPLQSPPQPTKTDPGTAVAPSETGVPKSKYVAQVPEGQLMPDGVYTTLPVPLASEVLVTVSLALPLPLTFATAVPPGTADHESVEVLLPALCGLKWTVTVQVAFPSRKWPSHR